MNNPSFIFTHNGKVLVKTKGPSWTRDHIIDIKIGKCDGCLKNNVPVILFHSEPHGNRDLRGRIGKGLCLECVTKIFSTFVVGVEPGLKETKKIIDSDEQLVEAREIVKKEWF